MRFLGLEIKRVLTTRLTGILLSVAILCSIFMAYIPVTSEAVTYTGDNGQEVQLKGIEAVKYLQETRTHMEGEVTPEKAKAALLCVVIAAPVFTSDYQTGADDILRCTKHGHGKMAVCKILSALLICGGAFLLCSIVWIVITNALFGWESTKTSIQFIFSISSLPDLTVGETQWVNLASSFFMFFAVIQIPLFLGMAVYSHCKMRQ